MRSGNQLWWVTSLVLASLPGISCAQEWPSPKREFRAAWVATVANIDWPSKKGLSTIDQQKELLAILDQVVALRMNAVIFQVRPMCDALYESKIEPWSEFITGTIGKAPEPFYDPLAYVVKEAHARGLELHAWFNPYRAHHPSAKSPIPDSHIVKSQPQFAKRYGRHYWLNPTNPEVLDHSLRVIMDVVKRYDIDGIHLDDYFYPYKENDADGKPIDFPDDDTWAVYQKAGGGLSRDDWRRDAVNRFVERQYRETKAIKPWVKVGISPFGIWRPGNPPGIEGLDQYGVIYADAKLWLNKGWVDYYTPQLYWPINQAKQSYPRLLAWWVGENTMKRQIWPGNSVGRAVSGGIIPPTELADQIKVTRAQAGASGNVFFSMKSLQRNKLAIDSIRSVYTDDALIPAMPWLVKAPPVKPSIAWKAGSDKSAVDIEAQGDHVRFFVLRSKTGNQWSMRVVQSDAKGRAYGIIPSKVPLEQAVVTAIDRSGNESEPATIN